MQKQVFPSRWLIALFAATLSLQVPFARAELVTTDEAAGQKPAMDERAKVQSFLEQASVKERLQALGVDGVLAQDRVAALSEEEIHALAQRIDTLPAGGNLSNTDIILILLVAILVAIII